MSVKIRMKRLGTKKTPFYRIIVADSRRARNGRFIEELGYYNPITEPKTVKIDNERVHNWLDNGARPTPSVDKLFKTNGVYEKTEVEEESTEE